MAQIPPQLPPKQEVALALLQTASSVYVHLDPRPGDVLVPTWFKKQPQLVLQIGLNMAVQIPDLDVSEAGISCTLSFNRTPEFCKIPYSAIFGLVGEDGRGMIWPESVPSEVAAAAPGRSPVAPAEKERRPKLRVAKGEQASAEQASAEQASAEQASAEQASAEQASAEQASAEQASAEQASAVVDSTAPEVATEAAAPSRSPAGVEPTEGTVATSGQQQAKKKRELPPYLRVVK